MNSAASNRQLKSSVDGHRFTIWVPVNQSTPYSISLIAASANGDRAAYKNLNAYEVRQAAVEGVKLTLRSPVRKVDVKVMDEGQRVAGAWVKAELEAGIELRSRANADGIARFMLAPIQKLVVLTAWTDDFRMGGFSFYRKPIRDRNANKHIVELSGCRDQKLRFIDKDGSPVPGIDFVIQMATAAPDFNYVGTNEHSRLTTDAAGEVIYKWFPDWDDRHFYAELLSDRWIRDGDHRMVDDTVVFTLKKRTAVRKPVSGQVVSTSSGLGGFYVTLSSFQGEQENSSDNVWSFTDADGSFSVDVLPDVTYCAYVFDSRWVSDIVDLIPYQSKSNSITAPRLSVSEGQEVEVEVTAGAAKRPYSNVPIFVKRLHEYTWKENGETQRGNDGPQWWTTTDESGRIVTRTLPGRLKVSVYSPLWRTEKTVNIRGGAAQKMLFHREVEEKRNVTGRLVLPDGLQSSLEDAEVKIGSVDGHYDDELELKCGKDGSFSFEILSTEIGVFGSTKDGRAAGGIIVTNLDSPIELRLRPTMEFQGRLLGEGDRPLVGHHVRAIARIEGEKDYPAQFSKSLEAKRIKSQTNELGNYTLAGIPSEMKVSIQADAIEDSNEIIYLGEVYLEPNESRVRAVNRLTKISSTIGKETLPKQYRAALRDCDLSGFHLMIIVASKADNVTDFVRENLIKYERNIDVASFMQIVIAGDPDAPDIEDAAFLKGRNWQLPVKGRVFAYAIDAKGKELGRLEVDVTNEGAVDETAKFIHRHAPPQVDAEKKWSDAFAEAKRSNRRVWARISQRYCGPCIAMTRWLDDHRAILEKDYVLLKIDNVRDKNGGRVALRLTGGEEHSIPFHAIFDQGGELMIDSAGSLGNIGYASGFEGKKHLRKMVSDTRRNLTDDEVDRFVESVRD